MSGEQRMRRILATGLLFLVVGGAYALGRVQGREAAFAVAAGQAAPPLRGTTADGEDFSLESRRGEAVVLVFYRGADCPLCVLRLRRLASSVDRFDDVGARIVAVTRESPAGLERLREALDTDLDLVSVEPEVLRAWGAWDASADRPLEAAAIVDAHGRLRFRHAWHTPASRVTDVELLTLARGIGVQAAADG